MPNESILARKKSEKSGKQPWAIPLTQNLVPQNSSIVWFSMLTHLTGRRSCFNYNAIIIREYRTALHHAAPHRQALTSIFSPRFRRGSLHSFSRSCWLFSTSTAHQASNANVETHTSYESHRRKSFGFIDECRCYRHRWSLSLLWPLWLRDLKVSTSRVGGKGGKVGGGRPARKKGETRSDPERNESAFLSIVRYRFVYSSPQNASNDHESESHRIR